MTSAESLRASESGAVSPESRLRVAERGDVVFLCGSSWYLWNFRLNLAKRLAADDMRAVFMAPQDEYSAKLAAAGRFVPIPISRRSRNPFRELFAIASIWSKLRAMRGRPVLAWTPKANLYGGIASRLLGNPFFPNIAGLGYAFSRQGWLSRLTTALYRYALGRARVVFFQNADDLDILVRSGAVDRERATLLPGSGVDVDRFRPTPLPTGTPVKLLFAGRLIEQKGIRLLVEAVRQLREAGHDIELHVVGFVDEGNPTALSQADVDCWNADGDLSFTARRIRSRRLSHAYTAWFIRRITAKDGRAS